KPNKGIMSKRGKSPGHSRDRPPAGVVEGVERACEQFLDACAEAGIEPPAHPELLAVLRRVWAGSAFVAQGCISHPGLLDGLLRTGDLYIEYPRDGYARRVDAALYRCRDEQELAVALRHQRLREMIRIAWRDLAG